MKEVRLNQPSEDLLQRHLITKAGKNLKVLFRWGQLFNFVLKSFYNLKHLYQLEVRHMIFE